MHIVLLAGGTGGGGSGVVLPVDRGSSVMTALVVMTTNASTRLGLLMQVVLQLS